MAARENQGLKIALIIFAILTVFLVVVTFVLFNYYKETRIERDRAQKLATDAQKEKTAAIDETMKLKTMVGVATNEDITAVEAAFTKDMAAYAKSFPEAKQHYRNVIEYLSTQLRDVNSRLTDRDANERKLQEELKTAEATSETKLNEYKVSLEKNQQDSANQRADFDADRNRSKEIQTNTAKKLEKKNKEFDEVLAATKKETEDITARLTKAIETNTKLVGIEKDKELSSEIADGKVTWVSQRGRVAWVSLGADDGLRKQISFKVFGADENNPLKAETKGSIEVTRILDRHLAEARIIEDDPAKPIMPGDYVYSVAWQPGRAEHFALVGILDVDGDGQSDHDKVKDIITLNGGVIDAELKDDGTITGELTVDTQFLVLGTKPDDKSGKDNYLGKYMDLVNEAKGLPIKTIKTQELLDYLGYRARERTIPLGSEAKACDFKPRLPDGVQRKSNNNMFKPRRGSPTGPPKSTY